MPDPYDGLIEASEDGFAHVHACMGSSLYVGDQLVGVLTVDAINPDAFEGLEIREFATLSALAAAAMRTVSLIDTLEQLAERRGQVTRQLIAEALQRGGGEILGRSPAIEQLKREISVLGNSNLTVLITGQTGTGKELVARTIHARSKRSEMPLVYVNCAALPESIAESELFGHVSGSFTGATKDRPGKFELADGGTLFLDEIGELPLSMQPKLLRALQSGEIQRIGAGHPLQVDVRIIAATNRNLKAEVREARFRSDLYHRLSVYPIHVPPLVERPGDISLLAGHFLDRARIQLGLGTTRLTRTARRHLEQYEWPGNVRELDHVITRAVLRASTTPNEDGVILVSEEHLSLEAVTPHINPPVLSSAIDQAITFPEIATDTLNGVSFADAREQFEIHLIKDALEQAQGNWSKAARLLKVDRSNLFRMAKRLGLK